VEGALKELFMKVETHGFTVFRHLNWDDYNWVAITPVGSVVIFRDRTDWTLYAVYSNHKGRYHVHIPYAEITALSKEAEEVLNEVFSCLRYAECYIDRAAGMVYSINRFRIGFIPFDLGPHRTR
jgi:hypothetical protein